MASLEELERGLVAADAAGNGADAKVFADEIRKLRGEEAPSMMGSAVREFGRSLAPMAAGFATGAGGGAVGGSLLGPPGALVGGFITGIGGAMTARKLQDMAGDKFAPDSFLGTKSSQADYEENPLSTLGGGTLAGGRLSVPRMASAGRSIATAEGRQILGQVASTLGKKDAMAALQQTNPAALNKFGDFVDVVAGAGASGGLSAASGESMQEILANIALGGAFNKSHFDTGSNLILPRDTAAINGPAPVPEGGNGPMLAPAENDLSPAIQPAAQAPVPAEALPLPQPPITTPSVVRGPMPETPLAAGPGADPLIQSALGEFAQGLPPVAAPSLAPENPMVNREMRNRLTEIAPKDETGAPVSPELPPAPLERPVMAQPQGVPAKDGPRLPPDDLRLAMENAMARQGQPAPEALPVQPDLPKQPIPPNEPNPSPPELQQGLPPQELPPPQLADAAAPALPERGGVPVSEAKPRGTLYREASIENTLPLIPGTNVMADSPFGDETYFATTPELALGQAKNKGVTMEFDDDFETKPPRQQKPGMAFVSERGGGEERISNLRLSEHGKHLKAITIKPDAISSKGDRRNIQMQMEKRLGWPKTVNQDGSITYRRPATTEAPSLRQKLQSTSDRLGESIRSDISEGRLNVVFPGLDATTAKRVYKLAIDTSLAAIDVGERIGKAVNKAIVAIKADLGSRWRPEMEGPIRDELKKNLSGEIDKRRQNIQQTADTARKVAVGDVKEGAPKPGEAEFKKTLAEKLPDQKEIIDADSEPQAIYDEPSMKPGDYPDEGKKTDWQDYHERTGERVERAVEDLKSGKTTKEIGQKVGGLRRELFTSKSAIAHEVADGKLPGTTKSEAAKEFIDDVMGTVPGADGVAKNGADADFVRETTKRVNVLDGIYKGLQPRMERMSSNDRRVFLRRIGDLLTNENADLSKEPADVRKAIEGVRDFFQKAQMDLHQAGYDLGDFGEFSMPRIYDAAKRANNPEAFHRDLVKTYEAKFTREIKAAEDAGDDVLLHKLREKYQPGEALKRALAYERNLAMNDAGISTTGDDFKLGDNDGVPNFLKAREFGEEADRLLGEYYVRDPFEVAKLTAENTERLITMVRVLGKVDPKTGKLDRLGRWNDLRDKLMAEDNGQMVPELARVIANTFGLGQRVSPKWQKFGEFTRTWMWLSFLDRAAVSSLAEPLMAGISTRSVGVAAQAFGKAIKQAYRRLAKLPPNESQIIAEALGYVQSGILSRMAAAHASDPFASGGMAKTADGFFRMTGLTGWTHSTAEAVSDIGFEHMVALSRLAKTSKLAARDLESFGVSPAEIDTLRGFADNMGNDRVGKILGNSPGAAIMRKAHAVYMRRTSINPTQGDKALHAAHPVGQMFYGLQSYLYSYTKNVTAKLLRDARKAATSKDLPPTERAKLGATLPLAMLGMGAANFGITMLREALFQDPERKKKDAKKTSGEITKGRLLASASRANFLGPYDPIFNAITAAKYQRDPATVMVGPVWGAASELFGQLASQGGGRDSPNTNTAERKIGRLAYQIGVKPATSAFLSGLPATRAAGVANYAISHPATRETFVRGTVGAPNAPERGKSAKKGPMPGNF